MSSIISSVWDYYVTEAQALGKAVGLSGGRPLNASEQAELQGKINADIEQAAGGNTELALEQKAQAAEDMVAVQKQFETQYNANSIWSEITSGLGSLGPYLKWIIIAFVALFVLSLLVKLKQVVSA